MLAGLAQVLPKNVWQYVVQIPRLASLGRKFVLQEEPSTTWPPSRRRSTISSSACPTARSTCTRIPARPARSAPRWRRSASSSAGAIDLHRPRGRDQPQVHLEERRRDGLHFCENNCKRTFIDTVRPDGSTSRYIAVFPARRAPSRAKKRCSRSSKSARRSPSRSDCVDYEAKRAFMHVYDTLPMPATGRPSKTSR